MSLLRWHLPLFLQQATGPTLSGGGTGPASAGSGAGVAVVVALSGSGTGPDSAGSGTGIETGAAAATVSGAGTGPDGAGSGAGVAVVVALSGDGLGPSGAGSGDGLAGEEEAEAFPRGGFLPDDREERGARQRRMRETMDRVLRPKEAPKAIAERMREAVAPERDERPTLRDAVKPETMAALRRLAESGAAARMAREMDEDDEDVLLMVLG